MIDQKIIARFEKKYIPEPNSGCWLWLGYTDTNSYGRIQIDKKSFAAHRLSWQIHNGSIPKDASYHGICVCHKCDTPSCVNPDHLFLGTHKDNHQDSVKKCRRAYGEKSGVVKLNSNKVKKIKILLITGIKQCVIAKEFRVHYSTISNIKTGRTWNH